MDLTYYSDNYYGDRRDLRCDAVLQNRDLWKKFHEIGTEMIITKSGRRMFPALRVQVNNLDPNARYCVLLELSLKSDNRYKYSGGNGNNGGCWSPAGSAEPHSPHRIYLHPDSPATGAHWMAQTINFNRLKLTNSAIPHAGHVVLSSMHKYQPTLLIVQASDLRALPWAPATTISFPETQFIAVTAYQNDKITKLKIDNNPFAKGFRENGQSRCKRKRERQQNDDTAEDTSIMKKAAMSSDESVVSSPEPPTTTERLSLRNDIFLSASPSTSTSIQTTVHPSTSWYNYSCPPSCKCTLEYNGYESVSYFPPQIPAMWAAPPYPQHFPHYVTNYSFQQQQPHNQQPPTLKQKPKCLTDFSIRAIIDA